MSETKHKVVIDFCDQSYNAMQKLMKECGFVNLGDAFHACFELGLTVHHQSREGCTELFVRNPVTKSQRTLKWTSRHSSPGRLWG